MEQKARLDAQQKEADAARKEAAKVAAAERRFATACTIAPAVASYDPFHKQGCRESCRRRTERTAAEGEARAQGAAAGDCERGA